MQRIVFITLLFFTMGFETYLPTHRWAINRTDPGLWINVCDATNPATTESLIWDMVSIAEDYNSVATSYLRLYFHPNLLAQVEDVSGELSGYTGDYTYERARNRTITICFNYEDPTAAGEAELKIKGNRWVGCSIGIDESYAESGLTFIALLTHELGHCAGLGHPQETTQAIMSYNADIDAYRLLIDDKMGLTYLYPMEPEYGKETYIAGLSCS